MPAPARQAGTGRRGCPVSGAGARQTEPARSAGTAWAEPPGPWGWGRRQEVRGGEGLHGARCGHPEPSPPSWMDPAGAFRRLGVEAVGEGLEAGRAATGARSGAAGSVDPGSPNTVRSALGVTQPLPRSPPPVAPVLTGRGCRATPEGTKSPLSPHRRSCQGHLASPDPAGCRPPALAATAPSCPLASGPIGLVVFVSPPGLRGIPPTPCVVTACHPALPPLGHRAPPPA